MSGGEDEPIPSLEELLAQLDLLEGTDPDEDEVVDVKVKEIEPDPVRQRRPSKTDSPEVISLEPTLPLMPPDFAPMALLTAGRLTPAQERAIAASEQRAFEARQRKEKEEQRVRELEARRKRAEEIAEAWETRRMAAEEEDERRVRAARYALQLEDELRRRARRESCRRKELKVIRQKEREERRKIRAKEREKRLIQKAQEKARRMAESGYAWGPSGWVRVDWALGGPEAPADEPETPQVTSEEEQDEDEVPLVQEYRGEDRPSEVVEQPPMPDDQRRLNEVTPLEEVLASLDKSVRESWEHLEQPPPLEDMLTVIEAEFLREEQERAAAAIRENFQELGKSDLLEEVGKGEGQAEPLVLQAAAERCPQTDWSEAVVPEKTLKPWNDFVEEKQEGFNSFDERQARSAAIQAKLQAARNRLSVVRWQPRSAASSIPAAWIGHQQPAAPTFQSGFQGSRRTGESTTASSSSSRPGQPPSTRPWWKARRDEEEEEEEEEAEEDFDEDAEEEHEHVFHGQGGQGWDWLAPPGDQPGQQVYSGVGHATPWQARTGW